MTNESPADARRRDKAVLVLSGGAPNSPLVAGALSAIYQAGKTFDVVFASGAGALLGMLYLAPKGKSVPEALAATLDVGIDDTIYKYFPLGYKTFFKSGPFTMQFIKAAAACQWTNPAIPTHVRRFFNDWIDLCFMAACPTDLNPMSLGLCRPVPFVSDIIDFELLRSPQMLNRFFMNAYCIEDGRPVNFGNQDINIEHFQAALAFPFVYSPATIGGKHYFEGSSVDPINFGTLLKVLQDVLLVGDQPARTVNCILMDLLGAFESSLVRLPRNLIDAYAISIVTPICSLAKHSVEDFKANKKPNVDFYSLPFDVPEKDKPFMLDWTDSNLNALWVVGQAAGRNFLRENAHLLPDVGQYPIPRTSA